VDWVPACSRSLASLTRGAGMTPVVRAKPISVPEHGGNMPAQGYGTPLDSSALALRTET